MINEYKNEHLSIENIAFYANAIIENKIDLVENNWIEHTSKCAKCAIEVSDFKRILDVVNKHKTKVQGYRATDTTALPYRVSKNSDIGKIIMERFPIVNFENSRNKSSVFEDFLNSLYVEQVYFTTNNDEAYRKIHKLLIIDCVTDEVKPIKNLSSLPFVLDFNTIEKEGTYRCVLTVENKLGDLEKIYGIFTVIKQETFDKFDG